MKGIKAFREDEKAVSPVIGVILMVAITVILAAVIGTFVLNLGGSVQENIQAGANVECTNNNEVKVTFSSNQNADDGIEVSLDGGTTTEQLTSVGDSFTSSQFSDGTSVDVTVIAESGDQSTVVQTDTCEF